jgi:hypothetical protein
MTNWAALAQVLGSEHLAIDSDAAQRAIWLLPPTGSQSLSLDRSNQASDVRCKDSDTGSQTLKLQIYRTVKGDIPTGDNGCVPGR